MSALDPQTVAVGRFLEQSTFGPTPALMAHVKQVGISAFIGEQFAAPQSPWPPFSAKLPDVVDAFFANALNGKDQLRQRLIGALTEILVIARSKNNTSSSEVIPWLQLLSRNAFGNYRTLLREITLDASMGKYLDLVNSGAAGAPNENFPRELMELFSLGVSRLDFAGAVQTDSAGIPIPTYTQADVQQLAKALTGWTYGSSKGLTSTRAGNQQYYPGPMIPYIGKHDTSPKTLLGQAIPANQAAEQDLDRSIDIIFNHPNIGPFVATRLIRALVTSNPSAAYIARVAMVFNGTATNLRGDMQATISAVLLDPEARNDNPPADFGRLRAPMQHTVAIARALNLNPGPAQKLDSVFIAMNERILDAPSVFGHYSPLYRIPETALFGPEFQIYSTSDAVNRANFFYSLVSRPGQINPVLQPFVQVAGTPSALVDAVDNALLYGRMLPGTRAAILAALAAQRDNNGRVLAALYLTFTSGEYLVQH
jgi:uncharacterized protein (DUF1800 family)